MELTALKVKTALLSGWSFVKHYWVWVAVACGLVAAVLFAEQKEQAVKNLLAIAKQSEASHRANIDQLQQALQVQIQQRDAIQHSYEAMAASIHAQNDAQLADLARQHEADIRRLMAQYQNNPDAMAAAISSTYGIPVVHFQTLPSPPLTPPATPS